MTDFLVELFIRALNVSISAVFLVAAVLLLRLIFRRAPRWIPTLLWGIVGVRLLLSFSVQSVFSLIPSAETVSPDIVYDPAPAIHSGIYALNSAVNPVLSTSFAPAPGDSVNPLQVWLFVGAVVWILGILGMLCYLTVSYLQIRRRVRDAVRLETGIFESSRVQTPFVLGFFRPRIYLPAGLPRQDAVHVIAHEREHIRRRDHLIKPLGFLLLSVHWFNPLLWAAYVLLCRDIEIACDERVIRDMPPAARADYSEALLCCSIPRYRIAACPLAFGEVGVKARVKHVLSYKKPAFWLIFAAMICAVVVAVCFLTNPIPPVQVDIDAHAYAVEDTVYQSTILSVVLGEWENVTHYTVTENLDLLRREASEVRAGWRPLGRMTAVRLTKSEFDDRFPYGDWADGYSAAKLRRRSTDAWQLTTEDGEVYVLLQTEDGEVYLAAGMGSTLYFAARLEKDIHADTGMIALSGGQSIPVVCCRADTPLSEVLTLLLRTLVITPNDEDTVPFHIFCDGREQYGLFSVYDAETLQPLDFFRPSGLSPQTYIFQNAQYGREYLVTMKQAVTADYAGDMWCFLAVLSETNIVISDEMLSSVQHPIPLAGYYVFNEVESFVKPSVILFEDGTCQMTFSAYSSYLGVGTYEITEGETEDRLILRTDDGKYTYEFWMIGDSIVFDAISSSTQLWGAELYHCAVLTSPGE